MKNCCNFFFFRPYQHARILFHSASSHHPSAKCGADGQTHLAAIEQADCVVRLVCGLKFHNTAAL